MDCNHGGCLHWSEDPERDGWARTTGDGWVCPDHTPPTSAPEEAITVPRHLLDWACALLGVTMHTETAILAAEDPALAIEQSRRDQANYDRLRAYLGGDHAAIPNVYAMVKDGRELAKQHHHDLVEMGWAKPDDPPTDNPVDNVRVGPAPSARLVVEGKEAESLITDLRRAQGQRDALRAEMKRLREEVMALDKEHARCVGCARRKTPLIVEGHGPECPFDVESKNLEGR